MKFYFLTDESDKSLAPFFSKHVLDTVMGSVFIVGTLLTVFWSRRPLSEIIATGKASLTFKQEVVVDKNKIENVIKSSITNGEESEVVSSDQVLCRGQIKIACLDTSSMRPCAIPDSVRKEILGDN